MGRRMLAAALALSIAAVMGGATPAWAARTRVKIVDFAFKKKKVVIPQGTVVKWVNRGEAPHTVTSRKAGLFDSGTLNPGESFKFRFRQTGVFKYYCQIHPEMRGRVLPGDV